MPKIVDHDARRSEICAIAVSLIARGGMEAATIREIAQESGYSKGVVEHYFENKEELISGALDWINQCYERRVNQATVGLTGVQALRKRMQATVPTNKVIRDEWKVRLVFWSMAAIQEELRKAQEQRFVRAADAFESDILSALRMGELNTERKPGDLARQLVNAIAGLSVVALHSRSLYTRIFILQEVEAMIAQLGEGFVNESPLRRAK
ncbi:MAG: TetR/AcrR family transcriptional regulator [Pseudomonadales bacterium]